MTTPSIEVKGLHKQFGDLHVLRGIDYTVSPGEGVVLLGANGCGKSTMMRCLNGLERIDQGEILINGRQVSARMPRRQLRQVRSQVGVVFQRFNLVGNLTAFQNVMFGIMGARRWGLINAMSLTASNEDRERAMACLERVSLADKANQKAEQLSGGQQQRVAIARMLMQDAKIVLADEPIASLDPKAGREVMDLLWEVVRERNMTVICTLHQLDVAMEYADRFLGMKAGRIHIDAPKTATTKAELETLYQGHTRVDQPADLSMDAIGVAG